MPATDMGPKRRLVSPWVHQHDLRADLLNLYRKDPRFRRIVETELRPQWQAIERDFRALWPFPFSQVANAPPGFERLVAAAEGRRDPWFGHDPLTPTQSEQLQPYVEAVRQQVKSPLRLTWKGEPTAWAAEGVHFHVTHDEAFAQNDLGFRSIFGPGELHTIVLSVAPGMITRRINLPDRESGFWLNVERRNLPPRVEESWFDNQRPGPGLSADDWARLEQQAQAMLSSGIAELRDWYEANLAEHRPSALRREPHTLQALFRYLFPPYGKPRGLTRAERARLRRLAADIEVDLP